MTSPEYLKKVQQLKTWATRFDFIYEAIRFLYNREFASLVPRIYAEGALLKRNRRFMRSHNVQSIISYCKFLHNQYPPTLVNFYYSAAKYNKGIPYIVNDGVDFTERRKKTMEEWESKYISEMVSYDWLIDIDSDTHDNIDYALDTLKSIHKLFTYLKVPHEIRFTGCGFHIIVPYDYLEELDLSFNPDEKISIYHVLSDMSKKLHDEFSEMVDYSIIDSRRVIRLPYSLSFYLDNTFVCTPLMSEKEIDEFKIENYTYDVMKTKIIKNRGTFMFNDKDRGSVFQLMERLGI